MKLILLIVLFSFVGFSQIFAQSESQKNNVLLFRSDIVLYGSETYPRLGIGIGYGYFYNKLVFKTFVEASRKDNSNQDFTEIDSKFRIKAEVEYLLNSFFSIAVYGTPTARYYSYYSYLPGLNYKYLTDFSIALGIKPSVYHNFGRLFVSIGTNLPFVEVGQFITDLSDPLSMPSGFISEEFTAKLFYKEIEGLVTLGFLF